MTTSRLILLFARSPKDEQRHKPLGHGADGRRTEALHRALLERTLDAVSRVRDADLRIVTTGDLDEVRALAAPRIFAARLRPARLQLEQQLEGTLGERLAHAVAGGFASGYRQVVLIGGDVPELNARKIDEAFTRLEEAGERPQAVLGPALDGGYYLLGLNQEAEVFTTVALSTSRAGADTARALGDRGFAVATLAPLDDLDNLSSVIALSARLRSLPGESALRALLLAVLAPPAGAPTAAATRLGLGPVRPHGPRAPPLFD